MHIVSNSTHNDYDVFHIIANSLWYFMVLILLQFIHFETFYLLIHTFSNTRVEIRAIFIPACPCFAFPIISSMCDELSVFRDRSMKSLGLV